MNLHMTFRNKKTTEFQKLKSLLQEVDVYLTEGIQMDKKCKKDEAIKAYSVAIDLMDYALGRFPIQKKNKEQMMKLVMKFHSRITWLHTVENPEEKKMSEYLSVKQTERESTIQQPLEIAEKANSDDDNREPTNWESQIQAIMESKKVSEVEEPTIPLSQVEAYFRIKFAELIDKGLISTPGTSKPVSANQQEEKESTKDEEEIKDAILSTLVRNPNKVDWEDVIGFEEVKSRLSMAVVAPIMFKDLWEEENMSESGILLYGPPGTGKTMISLATATASGQCSYFKIAASDLISRWQGQSERLVKCLFEVASELKPSLIFIDEVDGLFASRSGSDSGGSRRITNELLTQMQGQKGIFVLGTTNRPWEIDSGFFRRFKNHVYINLPTKKDRKRMWEKYLSKSKNVLLQRDYWFLAENSQNYSGADIASVVNEAKLQAVRRCMKSKYFRPNGNKFSACTGKDPQAVEMTCAEIPGGRMMGTPIDMRDMEVAFHLVKSKHSKEDEPKFLEHQKKYG